MENCYTAARRLPCIFGCFFKLDALLVDVTKFPTDIQTEFFKLFNDEISIESFEQWVYNSKELESAFELEDYIEFISINFKSRDVIYEIKKVVAVFLDYGEFEKRKINKILDDLISKNEYFTKALVATYDLYCGGYGFLEKLGIGYGLTFSIDFDEYSNWTKLSIEEKNRRIDAIYKGVKFEAEKVRDWLERNNLVITGEVNDFGRYNYIFSRIKEERTPAEDVAINLDEKKTSPDNKTLPKVERKWWRKLFGSK